MRTLGKKIPIPAGIIGLSSISIVFNYIFYHLCLTTPGIEIIPDLQSLIIKSSWSGITTYTLLILTTLISRTASKSFVVVTISISLIFNFWLFIKFSTDITDINLFYAALCYYVPSTMFSFIPAITIERSLVK